MSKKLEVTGLSPELEKFMGTLNKIQVESIAALATNEERVDYIELLNDMASDVVALDSVCVDNVDFSSDEDDCRILTFGEKGTIKAGDVISGRLIGTMPIFTTEEKENWEVVMFKGVKYFFNKAYRIATRSGKEFAIFDSPMLRILSKVVTPETCTREFYNGKKIDRETPVSIRLEYHGKLSKEQLEKDYAFKMKQGTEGHAFKVSLSSNAIVDKYSKGVLNWTRNPQPIAKGTDDTRDMLDVNADNYAMMHGENAQASLGLDNQMTQ